MFLIKKNLLKIGIIIAVILFCQKLERSNRFDPESDNYTPPPVPNFTLIIETANSVLNMDESVSVFLEAILLKNDEDISNRADIPGDLDYSFSNDAGIEDLSVIEINSEGVVIPLSTGKVKIKAHLEYKNKVIESNIIPFEVTENFIETSPPEAIYPIDGEKIVNLQTSLIWSAIEKADFYEIEIVKDDGTEDPFANTANDIVDGNPFTVNAPNNSLNDVAMPDAWSYRWRIRANVTDPGEYSVATFNAYNDAVYVYCPEPEPLEEDICDVTGKTGTKNSPYQTINGALYDAKSAGLNVKVASRGFLPDSAYHEVVNLLQGVSVYGGYFASDPPLDTDFNEDDRNSSLYITQIQMDGTHTVTAIGVSGNLITIFDGFYVQGGNIGTNVYAMFAAESNESLTISNNTFIGGNTSGDGFTHAVFASLVDGSIFENNIIFGGNDNVSADSYAFRISSSSLVIRNNTIMGGTTNNDDTSAIYIDGAGTPLIYNNIIIGGNNTPSEDRGSYCINNKNSSPLILNNTLIGGNSTNKTIGIYNFTSPSTIVTNNIISVETGNSRTGISGTSTNLYNFIYTNSGTNYSGTGDGGTTDVVGDPPILDINYRPVSIIQKNLLYGGSDLSAIFTTDKDSVERTVESSGQNNGGDGWSMGAYEYFP
jgi:hypothetical protein